jgi:hypothetical protein
MSPRADGEHLLLAPGERAGELRAALAEHGEQPVDGVEAFRALRPRRGPVRAHLEVLEYAQRGEHLAAFGNVDDAEARARATADRRCSHRDESDEESGRDDENGPAGIGPAAERGGTPVEQVADVVLRVVVAPLLDRRSV